MYQRNQKSPSDNYQTQLKSSQLVSRPTIQTKQNSPKPLSQSKNEKEVKRQNRSEVSRLGHNIANIPISSPHKQDSAIKSKLAIQTKLTIGEPGDKYEREADSVAEKVVNQIDSPQFQQQLQAVQHQEEAEDSLQAKPNRDNLQSPFLSEIQLKAISEEPKAELPAKSIIQRSVAITGQDVSTDPESELNSAKGRGKPLDADLQRSMGQAIGANFSEVMIHTDAQSDRLNRSMNSRAFATGNDVFFRQNESNLRNRKGKRLLAHELAHTVQQGAVPIQRQVLQKSPDQHTKSILQRKKVIKAIEANTKLNGHEAIQRAGGGTPKNPIVEAKEGLIKNIGNKDPKKCRDILIKRDKKGELFSEEEKTQIQKMSHRPETIDWLKQAGIGIHNKAEDYLNRDKYQDWLTLEAGQRLLIKSLAVNMENQKNRGMPSPAYTQGLSQQIRTDEELEGDEKIAKEQERDGYIRNAFVNTLKERELPDEVKENLKKEKKLEENEIEEKERNSAKASEILTKIFLILQSGLKTYDKEKKMHIDYKEGDVAKALAHGGRVNIRIPEIKEGENPRELTDWIGITEKLESGESKRADPVYSRKFGTHHMSITKNKGGKRGKFEEEGGRSAAIKNVFERKQKLYGLDLSGGGLGKKDINGDIILPDGAHGHMFIGFTFPTNEKDGALQIGIETTAPGAPSTTGYTHNVFSTEATANPESTFHGDKKDKIGEGSLKDNQRLVDLDLKLPEKMSGKESKQPWLKYLEDVEEDWRKCLKDNGSRAYEGLVGSAFGDKAAYEELVGKRKYFGYNDNQELDKRS